MRDNPANSHYARLLLPGIVVAAAYLFLSAIPQSRALRSANADIVAHSTNIEQFETRLATLPSVEPPIASSRSVAIVENPVSHRMAPSTPVQSLGRTIAIFQANDIHCTAVRPEALESPTSAAAIQRLSLAGSFHNMLAAIERVHKELPNVLVVDLIMTRMDPLEPCHWEIAFRLHEGSE